MAAVERPHEMMIAAIIFVNIIIIVVVVVVIVVNGHCYGNSGVVSADSRLALHDSFPCA
jgi:hypothetical protein